MPPFAVAVPFGRGVPERGCAGQRGSQPVRQLAYWRRPNASGERLLVPELRQAGRPLLYSFRDVIALRTFVYLRGEHSLQKVRKAVSTLRDLGNRDHLAAYQLVATPSTIIWVDETGAAPTSSESHATGFSTSAWPTSSPSSKVPTGGSWTCSAPASCSASIPSYAAATPS